MDETKLKEYETLSEDRRRAVDIVIKAMFVGIAIVGFGSNYLLGLTTRGPLLLMGITGLGFFSLFHYSLYRAFHFNGKLHAALHTLANELSITPPLSTRFVFTSVWYLVAIFTVSWICVCIYTAIRVW